MGLPEPGREEVMPLGPYDPGGVVLGGVEVCGTVPDPDYGTDLFAVPSDETTTVVARDESTTVVPAGVGA